MKDPQVGWIAAIIIGGVAGWLAERFMKSDMGLLMNIVLGIVGAAVGSAILSFFGVNLGGWIGYLIAGSSRVAAPPCAPKLRGNSTRKRKNPAEALANEPGLCGARRDNSQNTTLLITTVVATVVARIVATVVARVVATVIATVVATAVGSPVVSARVSMVVINFM